VYNDDDVQEKQRCPQPDCSKAFKDLKAHMLTHKTEHPHKCPVATCEYHSKGFTRQYDRDRHTTAHYQGTIECGLCPASGAGTERSFSRADVFKRQLTTVHGVVPPNGKISTSMSDGEKLTRYTPDTTSECSVCFSTYSSARALYEHVCTAVFSALFGKKRS
jgi:hypothetical protein